MFFQARFSVRRTALQEVCRKASAEQLDAPKKPSTNISLDRTLVGALHLKYEFSPLS
jgi:hypothetical protein